MPVLRRRGFTLIEILIVIMTIGILASVAYPSLSRSLASHTVDSAASVMAADIETAFSLAARSRRPVVFACNVSLRQCRVTDQATGAVQLQRSYDRSSGLELASMTWAPTNSARPVVVGSSGIASQGFTVTLTHGTSEKRVTALRSGLVRIN